MADAMKSMKLGITIAVMLAIVVAVIGGTSHDVEFASFDTTTELSDELTLTNLSAENGSVVLSDTETTGTATTPVYDRDANVSRLITQFSDNGGDLDVTVTGYDEGGTQVSSQTYADPSDIDLTAQDGTEFDFSFDFSRDATSDESPSLDAYSVYELGQPTAFLIALVAIAGIAIAAFIKGVMG